MSDERLGHPRFRLSLANHDLATEDCLWHRTNNTLQVVCGLGDLNLPVGPTPDDSQASGAEFCYGDG